MLRTLVFDLDGTLIDSVPDLLASCNRIMAARGMPAFNPPELTKMVGDGAQALVQRIMAARGRTATAADFQAFLDDYLAHAAEATRPYPGVEATLADLQQAGWRMAVCTNKPVEAAHSVLNKLGLDGFFAAVGGGDSFPTRKPDPAHLLATIAASGGVPGAAVMVGDHHNDIAAAAGAGVPAIFASWGYGSPGMAGGAPVAGSIGEVPAIAARLLPSLFA